MKKQQHPPHTLCTYTHIHTYIALSPTNSPTRSPTTSPTTSPSKSPSWMNDGHSNDLARLGSDWMNDGHTDSIPEGKKICTTRNECNRQRKSDGFTNFYSKDYSHINTYGCFYKGENAFWGKHGSLEEKSVDSLSGAKTRSELVSI